jgi:hypothetical protein
MSFRLSFHQTPLGPTGAHWLDDPSDLSCQDSTRQHAVDGSRLSCKPVLRSAAGWAAFACPCLGTADSLPPLGPGSGADRSTGLPVAGCWRRHPGAVDEPEPDGRHADPLGRKDKETAMRFLPPGFDVPELLETDRFRIRPLTIHDLVKDYDAVMTSREHLWEQFGQAWGWPSEDLTLEQDLIELAGTSEKPNGDRRLLMWSCAQTSGCSSVVCISFRPRSKALTPRLPCGFGPARCPAAWTRCCMRPCGVGLPSAGRFLGLPGLAGSCHGMSTTRCPTGNRQAGRSAGRARHARRNLESWWIEHQTPNLVLDPAWLVRVAWLA